MLLTDDSAPRIAIAAEAAQEYITLTQAAKLAPGRPSTNCLWRWCRRGVKARSGEVVCLEHVRVGGKLFTCKQWVRDFGQRLAAADRSHFQQRTEPLGLSNDGVVVTAQVQTDLERELQEAGL